MIGNCIDYSYIISAFFFGMLAGYAVSRFTGRLIDSRTCKNTESKASLELAVTNERLLIKEQELKEIKVHHEGLERSLKIQQEKISGLNIKNAALEQKALLIQKLETTNLDKEGRLISLMTRLAEAETLLTQERKQSEEKISLLIESKDLLKLEFQNLANSIFEEKSQKFTEQNRTELDTMLGPLREQIGNFKKRIEYIYDSESKDRVSLYNEIIHLKELNQRISNDATNLTNALKGDNKIQGAWGEVILERVLEESGLKKGREYEVQVSLRDKTGKRFQPDVLIQLPDGKNIIIDSKVSLTAYERYYSADTENECKKAFKEHILSIRTHIKNLSSKNYSDLAGIHSLDFILMFIPVEAAFLTAIDKDNKLFTEAIEKNIMIVSPSTLLITLRIIQNIWRYEYQNKNAREIANKAGDLYDKFVGFVEAIEDVGKQLAKAKQSYENAYSRLAKGKGNLIKRAYALKEMGVKTKKNLPVNIFEE